jgi:hypothetical protein
MCTYACVGERTLITLACAQDAAKAQIAALQVRAWIVRSRLH